MSLGFRNIACFFTALLLSACAQDFEDLPGRELSVDRPASLNTTVGDYRLRPYDTLVADYFFNLQPQDEYVIQNGDEFEMRFATAPDLNIQQVVRPDGRISLPYVGEIVIAGKTPEQANAAIVARYRGKFRDSDLFFWLKRSRAAVEELRAVVSSNDRGQSKSLLVRPDGFINVPGIGEVAAGGRSLAELNADVNRIYGERWNGVSVDIGLQSTRNLFVYVLGAVNLPGAYPINAEVSVQQAVALAGGYRDAADMEEFYLLRKSEGRYDFRRVPARMLFAAEAPGVVELRADDIVYIPRRGRVQAAEAVSEVMQMLTFGGIGGSVTYQINK